MIRSRSASEVLSVCLVVVGTLFAVAGCGGGKGDEAARTDAQEYFRQVVIPIAEAEAQVEKVVNDLAKAPPPPKEVLGIYEKLLHLYKVILGKAEGYAATTDAVRTINAKLVDYYGKGVKELENVVRAIKNRDEKAADKAHKALAASDLGSIQRELSSLAAAYRIKYEPKSQPFH